MLESLEKVSGPLFNVGPTLFYFARDLIEKTKRVSDNMTGTSVGIKVDSRGKVGEILKDRAFRKMIFLIVLSGVVIAVI